jgi:hypothetical protein
VAVNIISVPVLTSVAFAQDAAASILAGGAADIELTAVVIELAKVLR